MIGLIVDLLQTSDFAGRSETIDTAKGKYKIAESVQEGIYQLKREKAWQRKKR